MQATVVSVDTETVPLFQNDTLPCYMGGTDCSDYTFEDDCNQYVCNRFGGYCQPFPLLGDACSNFYSGPCNKPEGKCGVAIYGSTPYGVCFGEPVLGGSCDDYNDCTENDVCKLGREGINEVGICHDLPCARDLTGDATTAHPCPHLAKR